MDTKTPPYPVVSIPDKVNIIIWFLLVTTCLAVLTRLVSKRVLTKSLGMDDYLVSIATV